MDLKKYELYNVSSEQKDKPSLLTGGGRKIYVVWNPVIERNTYFCGGLLTTILIIVIRLWISIIITKKIKNIFSLFNRVNTL